MAKAIRIEHPILNVIKIIMKRFFVLVPLLPQEEELDMKNLFKNVKWEEIQDVQDKGYEVEYVTKVAGVRGNEAEHEILQYLFYLKDTRTGENSLKMDSN
tara:strand:+ start:1369 stop:1668 length:300 start_codon:yes stop_codon:yes gene_type:complete